MCGNGEGRSQRGIGPFRMADIVGRISVSLTCVSLIVPFFDNQNNFRGNMENGVVLLVH